MAALVLWWCLIRVSAIYHLLCSRKRRSTDRIAETGHRSTPDGQHSGINIRGTPSIFVLGAELITQEETPPGRENQLESDIHPDFYFESEACILFLLVLHSVNGHCHAAPRCCHAAATLLPRCYHCCDVDNDWCWYLAWRVLGLPKSAEEWCFPGSAAKAILWWETDQRRRGTAETHRQRSEQRALNRSEPCCLHDNDVSAPPCRQSNVQFFYSLIELLVIFIGQ